eukprot:758320-Hanusia_phi.AAC.7
MIEVVGWKKARKDANLSEYLALEQIIPNCHRFVVVEWAFELLQQYEGWTEHALRRRKERGSEVRTHQGDEMESESQTIGFHVPQ